MIIQRSSSRRKKLFLAIAGIILIAGALVAALRLSGVVDFFGQNSKSGPTSKQTKQQKKTEADQKADFLDDTTQKSDADTGTEPEVPSSSSTIDLVAQQQGSSVVVTVKLNGQGYSSGSCLLRASANGKNTSQTADIIYQPEYSTCAGFSVPSSAIGTGTWDVSIDVTPANGSVITKSTTVKVQ